MMDDKLDSELVARAINFHGQPFQKVWETDRGEGDLQKLNVDSPDFSVYAQRHLNFQDRGKRLKLHQFIVKKAKVLFDPALNEREGGGGPPVRVTEPGHYAVLPPYDLFSNVDKVGRIKHFFQSVKQGDIIIASILTKTNSGLSLKVLCLDGEATRSVADLNIKAFCPASAIISAVDKKNLSRAFLINDLVCCEVMEVNADSEKLILGMKGVHATEHRARLGLFHSEDFTESYKQAQEGNKGEHFNALLEKTVGFNNPSNINCLSNALGLGMNNYSCISGMAERFPEGEYASELRQVQANKWAFRSVAEGIEHFKAGRHSEAFQCLNKALNIDPRNIEGLVARGALYANSGSFKKAIEDFENALKLNPNHQNARKYLGETLVAYGRSFEEENKMDEALKAYEGCLAILPYHEEAQNSIDYIKNKQANGTGKLASEGGGGGGELAIPGLTPSKVQGVKDTLKQLLGESANKEEGGGSSKKKKKEKKRRRHHRSSSTSSSSSSATSSSSSSSSSSDSSSASSQDSHHKKKHKRKGDHKDRSLSPLSKRMAMMDSGADNEGLSERVTHYNPPSMPYSFTTAPQPPQSIAAAAYSQPSQLLQHVKSDKESEYEQRVRKFLEQTKGDSDYEEKVRKFLDETAKWKKERKAMEEKAKKKKKKDKKARNKSKKKKRDEKRKKKAIKELEEKKALREALRREKQRRRSSTSHLDDDDEEYIFGEKPDIRMLSMGNLHELEDLQSKLSAYYAKVEKEAAPTKKKEISSDKGIGSLAGMGKSKISPKNMYDDQDDEKDDTPPTRNISNSIVDKKRTGLDIFADSPPPRLPESKLSMSLPPSSDSQSNLPSKFKMQIGNVGNRLKKKEKADDLSKSEVWEDARERDTARFIYVKEDANGSNDDGSIKKTPDMLKKKDVEEGLAKRPAVMDKLGSFRINPASTEKKKDLGSPEAVKPQKRKLRARTSDTDSSDSDPEPRRNLKKDQDRSPDSSRSRSRSRSRKKYSSESPKKYSSESRSSSYRKERSRSKSGSYRSRSRRYRSSESGSYRSRSYSRSRSRSRSGDYYRRSRSRSDDRHHYRNKYPGRYPRGNRGTYYRPRFQNYKSPRGGGNYVHRGHRSRGYNNRGGNRGYVPRMRGRGRPRFFHYKQQERRDYRRYDRGVSRSDDEHDMSPMRKVESVKERIDKIISEDKRHTGPLSEGEERDDEYIDRKEYDDKQDY